jgi:rSAM/selenodomain-associated transferase 2
MAPPLSIILPVLDEAAEVAGRLRALASLRARGNELIVVDGGSADGTAERALPLADRVVTAPRGRATQMNAGATLGRGEVLLFLHVDTTLPEEADRAVHAAVRDGALWGRFDVCIEGRHPLLKVVGRMMNLRSRLTGIATGDQAIFVRRDLFEKIGGYPAIPLMEDIALSKRLRRLARPACLHQQVVTAGRRWESGGVLRTVWLMWRLRGAYALGADPARLALRYGYRSRPS